jgi:hypothetical protein
MRRQPANEGIVSEQIERYLKMEQCKEYKEVEGWLLNV